MVSHSDLVPGAFRFLLGLALALPVLSACRSSTAKRSEDANTELARYLKSERIIVISAKSDAATNAELERFVVSRLAESGITASALSNLSIEPDRMTWGVFQAELRKLNYSLALQVSREKRLATRANQSQIFVEIVPLAEKIQIDSPTFLPAISSFAGPLSILLSR